jgi:hypothetical protein
LAEGETATGAEWQITPSANPLYVQQADAYTSTRAFTVFAAAT